jgi:hypothetical protein
MKKLDLVNPMLTIKSMNKFDQAFIVNAFDEDEINA